jgi:endonuclease III-like uncharacterized protein
MTKKQKLKNWLETLDSERRWNTSNLDKLEEQIVECVQGSGYINIKMIMDMISD